MVLRTLGIYTQERMEPGAKLSPAREKKSIQSVTKDFNIKPEIQKLLMKTLGKKKKTIKNSVIRKGIFEAL